MAYGAYHPRNPRGQQRDKLYREALRLVLCEDKDEPFPPVTEADGPMKRLRGIARVHVKKAEEGDLQAIRKLADRLDGKPVAETLIAPSEGSGDRFSKITWEIVHVNATREELDAENDRSRRTLLDRENDPLMIEHKSNGEGDDERNGAKLINGNGSGNGHGPPSQP